jgi:hypothetical protein
MTTNERRESAKKKASDDARDLNSLARGFTSNEEENRDTTNETAPWKTRHHRHRHIAPQWSALVPVASQQKLGSARPSRKAHPTHVRPTSNPARSFDGWPKPTSRDTRQRYQGSWLKARAFSKVISTIIGCLTCLTSSACPFSGNGVFCLAAMNSKKWENANWCANYIDASGAFGYANFSRLRLKRVDD